MRAGRLAAGPVVLGLRIVSVSQVCQKAGLLLNETASPAVMAWYCQHHRLWRIWVEARPAVALLQADRGKPLHYRSVEVEQCDCKGANMV